MFSVEVGDHDNAKKVYAWFYADIKNGSPDFSNIWNIGIKAPGHNYVEITDTVHDWPTQVNGESVDLKYRVAVGPNSLSPTHDTCLWPDLGKEKKFCYGDGNEGATKTYVDMVSADQNALRTMDETMTDLYGPNWRKG
jgi:hypothetical protein